MLLLCLTGPAVIAGNHELTFDAARMRFVGRKKGRIFAVGERIEVAVAKVDMYKQQIDFQPAPDGEGKGLAQRAQRPQREAGRPKSAGKEGRSKSRRRKR